MSPALEVTTRIGCKNMCSYCPQKTIIKKYSDSGGDFLMKFETFKKCLSKVPKNVQIDFSGMAEPWLNPDCSEMVLHTHKSGYNLSIFTTLVGMEKSDLKKIKDIPFQQFIVHLPDAEEKTKIKVDKKYLSVLEYLCENKVKNCEFHFFSTIEPQIISVLKNYRLKIKDISSNLVTRAGNLGSGKLKKKKSIFCSSAPRNLNHNVLLPNGDVILCCMDYGLIHKFGNLLKQDYGSLFKSKEHLRIKEAMKKGGIGTICMNCEKAIEKGSIPHLIHLCHNNKILSKFSKVEFIKKTAKKILKKNNSKI
ncbi:hypothetical protein GOV13_01240 [Candidatus Pacearchaeota archaeon]|nr:hypothetical protein [Candidatus Pacearchaeota archaeon]